MPRIPSDSYSRARFKVYTDARAMAKFIPRRPELIALEGDYDHFIFSCRHKDILRCSDTNHFLSCYNPIGFHNVMPVKYCSEVDNVAIIYQPDRSGKFKSRAFVFYEGGYTRFVFDYSKQTYAKPEKVPPTLVILKIYGTGLCDKEIVDRLSLTGHEVRVTGGDFHV